MTAEIWSRHEVISHPHACLVRSSREERRSRGVVDCILLIHLHH